MNKKLYGVVVREKALYHNAEFGVLVLDYWRRNYEVKEIAEILKKPVRKISDIKKLTVYRLGLCGRNLRGEYVRGLEKKIKKLKGELNESRKKLEELNKRV